ncbi:hypothetical protein [Evansella cellulosilytica]|uniref:Spo0E like sporulation regulatory protein n=1 Tax=Evansella cellulosilytica (strain ATCC 21833 / DSM 2522 / FERM P-1141 / JCM 9156 / N-4) TaxID=649639 RepID=E6TRC3_EVAC2|nr:hypothetical protein [Evansella cellulosilytica]ADU30635.1 hypothetical protein Bcell_2377 [Evansella cellulosilytica DSM 2522]
MGLDKNNSLYCISRDIVFLKKLMYKAKERLGTMNDPLLLEISQFLDVKLNQHGELLKSHKKTEGSTLKRNDTALDENMKLQIQSDDKGNTEQLEWQKAVIREEYVQSE